MFKIRLKWTDTSPNKEELQELYCKQRLTQREIARQFDVDEETVGRRIRKIGLKKLLKRETYEQNSDFKKKLVELYWNEEKTLKQIASSFGETPQTIWYWMTIYNIPRRTYSETTKGKKNPMYGKHHSYDIRKKIMENRKKTEGKNHWNWKGGEIEVTCQICSKKFRIPPYKLKDNRGKFCSKTCKHINHSDFLRKKWKNKEYRDKAIKKFFSNLNIRPNKKEQKLIEIINKYRFPFRYTGDGSFLVYGLNPDFVNCNGQKKIIELFGDYWHDSYKRDLNWKSTEFGRKAIFSQFGYSTLIIWEHELKNECAVVEKIKRFVDE